MFSVWPPDYGAPWVSSEEVSEGFGPAGEVWYETAVVADHAEELAQLVPCVGLWEGVKGVHFFWLRRNPPSPHHMAEVPEVICPKLALFGVGS